MLLQLHLLHRQAPKRLRQLKELHDIYKETLEFEEGGVKPKKANGSRWISHNLAALKLCKNKWELYIKYLEKMIEDQTIPSKDRARIKGYLKQWRRSKMLLLVSLFFDLLNIPSTLSLSFQREDLDPVQSLNPIQKTRVRLELFASKSFEKLPNVHDFLARISHKEDGKYFLDIKMVDYDNAKSFVSKRKNESMGRVRDCPSHRLEHEEESEDILSKAHLILDCETWVKNNKEFADDATFSICEQFRIPLKEVGMKVSIPDLLEQ